MTKGEVQREERFERSRQYEAILGQYLDQEPYSPDPVEGVKDGFGERSKRGG